MARAWAVLAIAIALAWPGVANAQGELSLEEVSRKLDNPLSDLWMIFTENGTTKWRGDPADGSQWVNTTIVQPVMPVSLTSKWNLVNRPIIPIITAPKFKRPSGIPLRDFNDFNGCPGGSCLSRDPDDIFRGLTPATSRTTELGDIVFWSMLSPADPPELPDGSNLVWGIGPSFMFPSATEDQFGSEKWSVGPSNILLRLPKPGVPLEKLTIGLFHQHLFSFAGSGDEDVRMSQFQPIYWWRLPWGQWQVGGFPLITVNWEAGSGNKLTLPLEIAVSNTFFVGPMPMRVGFGFNYSVAAPDDYGQRFMFKFFIVPVIPKPIKGALFE